VPSSACVRRFLTAVFGSSSSIPPAITYSLRSVRWSTALVLAALLIRANVVHADTVLPSEGVTFAQVDYLFDGAETRDSGTGQINVDIATLLASFPTIPNGFVNVATSDGWVVQTLPNFIWLSLPHYIDELLLGGNDRRPTSGC
jgi:hypothetical protein